jgi:hypothetical protein
MAMLRTAILVLVGLLAGCTAASDTSHTTLDTPVHRPAVLVLGEVGVADPLWETYRPYFRRGAEEWLRRNPSFEQVLLERPARMRADSAVLVGTITEMDKGDPKLRFFVRMGAGRARITGDFEIQGPAGEPYVRFTSEESYRGGSGGAGTLDLEDLFKRLGAVVAETAARWARGEPLDR